MLNNSVGDILCSEIARATVGDLAPDELPFFDEITAPDLFARPIRDEALAFGVGEALVVLTPTVVQIAAQAIRYAAPKLFDSALDIGKDLTKDAIRKKLTNSRGPNVPSGELASLISFTPEQLRHVQDAALKESAALGITVDAARQMTNAIVAKLALI